MLVALEPAHRIARRERLVGLIHHHKTRRGLDDRIDRRVVPQVRGRVVRVGDVDERRLVLAHRGEHRRQVELEVRGRRHADELDALQLGRHLVHHEARQRRNDRAARHIARHAKHRDQLVGPVAEHDVAVVGHAGVSRECGTQHVAALGRVAVQRDLREPLAERRAQRFGQAKRVLHRVELDHAGRRLHRVAVHRLNVLADHALDSILQAGCHFVSPFNRNSAARACACRPSP